MARAERRFVKIIHKLNYAQFTMHNAQFIRHNIHATLYGLTQPTCPKTASSFVNIFRSVFHCRVKR